MINENYLDNLTKQYNDLLQKYQGVRPSWVSTDLAILREKIREFERYDG